MTQLQLVGFDFEIIDSVHSHISPSKISYDYNTTLLSVFFHDVMYIFAAQAGLFMTSQTRTAKDKTAALTSVLS